LRVSISDKPDDGRPIRRWMPPDGPPVLRRGRTHRVVRWIGTGSRRPAGGRAEETTAADARVIPLSWAETFGRPARRDLASGTGAAVARILVFRRSAPGDRGGGLSRNLDQPSVPVLR
jgi:hypothetical protein